MQKTLILLIFLITYTICVDTECSKVTVKNTCQANTSCTWTDAVCAGHTSCTTANADKGTCEAVQYDGKVNCTWSVDTCSGGEVSDCTGTSENDCKILICRLGEVGAEQRKKIYIHLRAILIGCEL